MNMGQIDGRGSLLFPSTADVRAKADVANARTRQTVLDDVMSRLEIISSSMSNIQTHQTEMIMRTGVNYLDDRINAKDPSSPVPEPSNKIQKLNQLIDFMTKQADEIYNNQRVLENLG